METRESNIFNLIATVNREMIKQYHNMYVHLIIHIFNQKNVDLSEV